MEEEHIQVQLRVDREGRLIDATQIDDYLYRDMRLEHINFYDFVKFYQVSKKQHLSKEEHAKLKRYKLESPHPCTEKQEIVERYVGAESAGDFPRIVVCVTGMTIPRSTKGEIHALFMLAHFKPFSARRPLFEYNDEDIDALMKSYPFSERSRQTMRNWEEIYECEDERDEERMKRRDKLMKEHGKLEQRKKQRDESDENIPEIGKAASGNDENFEDPDVKDMLDKLTDAKFLDPAAVLDRGAFHCYGPPKVLTSSERLGTVDPGQASDWQKEIKIQEAAIQSARMNLLDPGAQNIRMEAESVGMTDVNQPVKIRDVTSDLPGYIPPTLVNNGGLDVPLSTADEVIRSVAEKHTLNKKQFYAFEIIARAWIKVYERRISGEAVDESKDNDDTLRLLMTGPGGTGKTHSVMAVREVMEYYGSAHRLRLTAMTGSAAALIDGTTCHKGLGIRVRQKVNQDGKSRTGLDEKYEVDMPPNARAALRANWKDVDIMLIDEVSLVSLQILSDIDHALRYAKEKPNTWFGGMIVVFSGDMMQFPPVCATALCHIVRGARSRLNGNQLKVSLGRLAWKTVNEVIEFDEQFRMKDDPEYAAAVGRLRLRECLQADVDLFNSRLIRSKRKPNGILLSGGENANAVTIVDTNKVREKINLRKAQSNSMPDAAPELVLCAALDFINGKPVPVNDSRNFRREVLALQTAALTKEGALPGYVPLYIGMPVILRRKHVSVDLKIANGCQGTVRHIEMGVDEHGFSSAKLVLVHFPGSKVKLTGLDPEVCIITPDSWSFSTTLELEKGNPKRYTINRKQVPIQPAFAVTGQSAQGKTLPKVIADLSKGGAAAYVAASRPRRREDIYLIQEVQLQQLNKHMSSDMMLELARFRALEHNTLRHHGYCKGELVDVPDPEERYMNTLSRAERQPKFEITWTDDQPSNKRKRKLQEDGTMSSTETGKRRKDKTQTGQEGTSGAEYLPGCQWSSQDYSCAYDAVFMSMYMMYKSAEFQWQHGWADGNIIATHLSQSFSTLVGLGQIRPVQSNELNWYWDQLRDLLSERNPTRYRRRGSAFASAMDLIYDAWYSDHKDLSLVAVNAVENVFPDARLFLEIYEDPRMSIEKHSTQCWVNACLRNRYDAAPNLPEYHSELCNEITLTCHGLRQPLEWLYFESVNSLGGTIEPTRFLSIPVCDGSRTYTLSSIIYFGSAHYTARICTESAIYAYDGQRMEGKCVNEFTLNADEYNAEMKHALLTLDGRTAQIFIYTLTKNDHSSGLPARMPIQGRRMRDVPGLRAGMSSRSAI